MRVPGGPSIAAPARHWSLLENGAQLPQIVERGIHSATHSTTLPTMSNAPTSDTQFERLPVRTVLGPPRRHVVLPSSPTLPSGVPRAAACHSAFVGRRLPAVSCGSDSLKPSEEARWSDAFDRNGIEVLASGRRVRTSGIKIIGGHAPLNGPAGRQLVTGDCAVLYFSNQIRISRFPDTCFVFVDANGASENRVTRTFGRVFCDCSSPYRWCAQDCNQGKIR